MAGAPVGLAWGVACLGVGLRWGTTSLGDVAVATRLSGPTVIAGPLVVRVGVILALAGALADEARGGGLRSADWSERAASAIAVVALTALFVVHGPADPRSELPALWGGLAAAGTVLVLQLHPAMRRMPALVPLAAVVAGAALAVVGG